MSKIVFNREHYSVLITEGEIIVEGSMHMEVESETNVNTYERIKVTPAYIFNEMIKIQEVWKKD